MNLTVKDVQSIIKVAQNEMKYGKYLFGITLVRPISATSGENHQIIYDSRTLESGSDSEPIPYVMEV
jgi:hypothetical protein